MLAEWWAWVDLNQRPRPYQRSVVRFYNNLQDRGDCQSTRKSHKTSHFVGWVVGWVVGWKKSTNSETTPHSFPRTSFWIVSELPVMRPEWPRRGIGSISHIGTGLLDRFARIGVFQS